MIEYTNGDILRDDSEALVNTVNCVGVMGRGVALQFKEAWPKNFKAYAAACEREEVRPGRMFVFETGQLTPPRYIVNFPTKRHWRGKSRIEDIDAGLRALVELIRERGIRSIAMPPLGSGLGGLHWPDVRARIEAALSELSGVRVRVYEPRAQADRAAARVAPSAPEITPGRAALVALMDRYLGGLLDTTITLLELHKLMYFLQASGEPLRLRYARAPYGPFAENLGHVLRAIEGHLVSGYADGGDAPGKALHLVDGAVERANEHLAERADTRERLARVQDLVGGFETPFGLELLSSVHWVIENDQPASGAQVVERMYAWNERKRQFSVRQIELAMEVLARKGWVRPFPAGGVA